MGKTFVEKILGAVQGTIVFKKPDLVLSHDNSASIRKTFEKMNGEAYSYSYHGPTYEYHSLSRDNSGYKVEPDDMVLDGKTVGSRMLASMYK